MTQPPTAVRFLEAIRRETLRRELKELSERYRGDEGRLRALQDEQEAIRRELAELDEQVPPREQAAAGRCAALGDLRSALGAGEAGEDPTPALYQAATVAQVGSQVPEFPYYGPVRRWLARQAARAVFFFAGVLTAHQRIFNARLVEVATALAARSETLAVELGRLRRELLAARLHAIEAALYAWEASAEAGAVAGDLTAATRDIGRALEERLATAGDQSGQVAAAAARERADLGAAIGGLRTEVAAAQGRLERLERHLGGAPGAAAGTGAASALAGSESLDRLYAAFEERFRGAREEIRDRLEEYLPLIRQVAAVSPDRPVLDLGCGRGEWLELLREAGVPAVGVDRNRVFLDVCRRLGLQVIEGDALAHLAACGDASTGAVTAFHVIEHMPVAALLGLLVQCHRVLAPGGLLLLETPNPGNLTVGAASFYTDPSHERPVYPATLVFLLENLGFTGVTLQWPLRGRDPQRQLEPLPGDHPAARSVNPAVEAINTHLRAPLDYGVVARKAG